MRPRVKLERTSQRPPPSARTSGMPIGQENSTSLMSSPKIFRSSTGSRRSHSRTGSRPLSERKKRAGSRLSPSAKAHLLYHYWYLSINYNFLLGFAERKASAARLDADVSDEPRYAGPVDDASARDDHVEGRGRLGAERDERTHPDSQGYRHGHEECALIRSLHHAAMLAGHESGSDRRATARPRSKSRRTGSSSFASVRATSTSSAAATRSWGGRIRLRLRGARDCESLRHWSEVRRRVLVVWSGLGHSSSPVSLLCPA